MKPKHIRIRIQQCLILAEASNCPRRKFGALLLDPSRNVVLMDGYNGGPRGGSALCGDFFCLRDGFDPKKARIRDGQRDDGTPEIQVHYGEHERVQAFTILNKEWPGYQSDQARNREVAWRQAEKWVREMAEKYPPIKSGTELQVGCHHAEMNVITNAAAQGVATRGAWLIVTGEPCLMCAKAIHHAGISKVIVVDGGYLGGSDGPDYLEKHGVGVERTDGPRDPREKGFNSHPGS